MTNGLNRPTATAYDLSCDIREAVAYQTIELHKRLMKGEIDVEYYRGSCVALQLIGETVWRGFKLVEITHNQPTKPPTTLTPYPNR